MSSKGVSAKILVFASLLISLNSCNNGEEETSNFPFVVFPNPFTTEFSLSVETAIGAEVKVYIYSKYLKAQTLGSAISLDKNPVVDDMTTHNSSNYRIDLSEWDDGTYLMDVVVDGKSYRTNLVKGIN